MFHNPAFSTVPIRLRAWLGIGLALVLAGCATPPPPSADSSERVAAGLSVHRFEGGRIDVDTRTPACRITLHGTLHLGTIQRLNTALAEVEQARCASKLAVLSAGTGSVSESVTIGAMLRNRDYSTQVQAGSTCLTPCLLVFAAGRERILPASNPPARIGYSQMPPDRDFGLRQCETELSRNQALTLTRYLRAMLPANTATAVYQKLLTADCKDTALHGPAEAMALGLATGTTAR